MGSDGGVPPQTPGANNPGNGESPIGPGNTPMPGEMEFTGQVEAGGMKVRAVSGDDSNKLRVKIRK